MKKWKFDLSKCFWVQVELQIILLVLKFIPIEYTKSFHWAVVLIPLWIILFGFLVIFSIGLFLHYIDFKEEIKR